MPLVHSLSLSRVRRKTAFVRYDLHENSPLQKVAGTTHTSSFTIILMSSVHSASFSLVQRRAKFLHNGSLDSSIFQRLLGTAEIARCMRISISAGHSARLRPVRHKTSFLRHERRENLIRQKVPHTTHTSCFTMNFVSFVPSGSLSITSYMGTLLCRNC